MVAFFLLSRFVCALSSQPPFFNSIFFHSVWSWEFFHSSSSFSLSFFIFLSFSRHVALESQHSWPSFFPLRGLLISSFIRSSQHVALGPLASSTRFCSFFLFGHGAEGFHSNVPLDISSKTCRHLVVFE